LSVTSIVSFLLILYCTYIMRIQIQVGSECRSGSQILQNGTMVALTIKKCDNFSLH
jgi:hypothetical protein